MEPSLIEPRNSWLSQSFGNKFNLLQHRFFEFIVFTINIADNETNCGDYVSVIVFCWVQCRSLVWQKPWCYCDRLDSFVLFFYWFYFIPAFYIIFWLWKIKSIPSTTTFPTRLNYFTADGLLIVLVSSHSTNNISSLYSLDVFQSFLTPNH